jgi:hypothetical protein
MLPEFLNCFLQFAQNISAIYMIYPSLLSQSNVYLFYSSIQIKDQQATHFPGERFAWH